MKVSADEAETKVVPRANPRPLSIIYLCPKDEDFFVHFKPRSERYAMSERAKATGSSPTKVCPKCDKDFPVNEEFVVCRSPDARTTYICKKCRQLEDQAHAVKAKGGVGWCS